MLLGRFLVLAMLPSGMLLAPEAWPDANSAGSQTSIKTPFSRLIRRTASAVDTEPAAAPPLSIGHKSMVPELTAIRTKIQLSRRNFTSEPSMVREGRIIEFVLVIPIWGVNAR